MLPTVTGTFRVGADPTVRFTNSGKAIASFSAVADKRKKDDSGEWKTERQIWLSITAFDRLAEAVAESVVKGSLVTVTGQLSESEWTDKDGNARKRVEIAANEIAMTLTPGKKASGGGSPAKDNPWSDDSSSEPAPF